MPGCQPLEHVYPNWRYLQTVHVTWQKTSRISVGHVVGGKKLNLRDRPFIGQNGKSIAMSTVLPRGSLNRPNGECELLIVPQKCVESASLGSSRFTCLAIEDKVFDELAKIFSSANYFVRVLEDPIRDGFFHITCSEEVKRASFDAFCVGDAATSPNTASFSGAINQPVSSPVSPVSASVRVVGNGGEFSVVQGQLPLHGTQNELGLDRPTFVVGPRAWQSIKDITSLVHADVSVFVSVNYYGTLTRVCTKDKSRMLKKNVAWLCALQFQLQWALSLQDHFCARFLVELRVRRHGWFYDVLYWRLPFRR
jgi:hypothetical protein